MRAESAHSPGGKSKNYELVTLCSAPMSALLFRESGGLTNCGISSQSAAFSVAVRSHMSESLPPLPDWLEAVVCTLPEYVNRKRGAYLIGQHLFEVSPRTLEFWPLNGRRVGRQTVISTRELFQVAYAKFAEAPIVRTPTPRKRSSPPR